MDKYPCGQVWRAFFTQYWLILEDRSNTSVAEPVLALDLLNGCVTMLYFKRIETDFNWQMISDG